MIVWSQNYDVALRYADDLLAIEPNNRQVSALKWLIVKKIEDSMYSNSTNISLMYPVYEFWRTWWNTWKQNGQMSKIVTSSSLSFLCIWICSSWSHCSQYRILGTYSSWRDDKIKNDFPTYPSVQRMFDSLARIFIRYFVENINSQWGSFWSSLLDNVVFV